VSGFVIRRARSGPPELHGQLPASGNTLDSRTDPQGLGAYFYANLTQPLKYRFPPHSNAAHCPPDQLDHDEQGPFMWVTAVVFSAHDRSERPSFGMREFAVDLAYVVDPSLAQDTIVDWAKIDLVGLAEIDDADDADGTLDGATGARDLAGATGTVISPDPLAVGEPVPATPIVSPEDFEREVGSATAALAALVGDQLGRTVVAPQRLDSNQDPVGGTAAAYRLGAEVLQYHGWDPQRGRTWWETTSPDELLYWIVDEIASKLAWRWAKQTPSYTAVSEQQAIRTLWMPYWHILVHALRPEWGSRTRATIRELAARDTRQSVVHRRRPR
jgi:hypothetical protein